MICKRCSKETRVWRMSFFNEDECCLECLEKEKEHPLYQTAKEIEHEHVKKGNYNFPGTGLPSDFKH